MDFSVSTKLPSENWLAAKFDVSRSTIRAVLAELETEGKFFAAKAAEPILIPAHFSLVQHSILVLKCVIS